jgi:VanZ family protein
VASSPGDQPSGSPRRIGRVICWLGYWLLLTVATHYPKPERFAPSLPGLDKVAHLITFAVLAVLGAWAWAAPARRGGDRRRWIVWAVLLVVFSAADELAQPMTGRDASLADFACDVVGIGVGLRVAWAWLRRGSPWRSTDAGT